MKSLVEDCRSMATVTTILSTLLLALQREYFLKMMGDFPTVREMTEHIVRKLDLQTLVKRGHRACEFALLDKLADFSFI